MIAFFFNDAGKLIQHYNPTQVANKEDILTVSPLYCDWLVGI